jgi:hypothetical protein
MLLSDNNSKIWHILVLLTLLLPMAKFEGCSSSPKENAKQASSPEMAREETNQADASSKADTYSRADTSGATYQLTVFQNVPSSLKGIFEKSDNTLTGLGILVATVLLNFPIITFLMAVILLITGLFQKFFPREGHTKSKLWRRPGFLLETVALVLLLPAILTDINVIQPMLVSEQVANTSILIKWLFGYWVLVGAAAFLLLYDYLNFRNLRG